LSNRGESPRVEAGTSGSHPGNRVIITDMLFFIYYLVSEDRTKTYVGFSDDLDRRISEHSAGKVKTTKNFGKFSYRILEKVNDIRLARIAEKYWKSAAGRKRLKMEFSI